MDLVAHHPLQKLFLDFFVYKSSESMDMDESEPVLLCYS